MAPSTAALVAILLPLVGGGVAALLGRHPDRRETATTITSVGLFALVAGVILPAVSAGARPRVELAQVVPGLSLTLEVEPLGMLFALVASGLWAVTSLYSFGYMRAHHEEHQTRFYFFFALAISGALGVAFAGNAFTLFVFYEVITVSTYPLVTHHGTDEARHAGRLYIGILMGTSIAFLLLAVISTWVLAGTTDFRPGGILAGKASDGLMTLLLVLYVFGTGKAALMPFHRWLPAAMVAPTPVSALLHAVAVVKAGVFTVMKVVVYVFGIENLQVTGASGWLTWAATFTVLAASTVAIFKDNLKARLAYSTIAQLSYIVLGAGLANEMAVLGGSMHILMHAFGKITLFFCAGAIYVAAHKTRVSELNGLGRRMPFTFLAFLIGSLSVIGLPPLGGSWSKWFLALGAAEPGQRIFLAVLMVSSLLSIAYLMPVVARAFFLVPDPEPEDMHGDEHGGEQQQASRGGLREAPFLCVLPPVMTAAGCVVLFFSAGSVYDLLRGMVLS